jgi:hypothetical protein
MEGRGVIAHKVLGAGRRSRFTGFVWPPPEAADPWVTTAAVQPCRTGIHACRIEMLPIWLGSELWQIELEGEVVEADRKIVASRGRLVRRIDAWNDQAKLEFADACADEARRRVATAPELGGYADDLIALREDAPLVGFIARRLAERHEGPAAYDAERLRQAHWLEARLGLREGAANR